MTNKTETLIYGQFWSEARTHSGPHNGRQIENIEFGLKQSLIINVSRHPLYWYHGTYSPYIQT